jgi:hypothetical protein
MGRPTTTQRGYGAAHQRARKRAARQIREGKAYCWRCLKEGRTTEEAFIPPDTPPDQWDLGHDDKDRSITRGPEHMTCNRSTGSRRPKRRRPTQQHPGLIASPPSAD